MNFTIIHVLLMSKVYSPRLHSWQKVPLFCLLKNKMKIKLLRLLTSNGSYQKMFVQMDFLCYCLCVFYVASKLILVCSCTFACYAFIEQTLCCALCFIFCHFIPLLFVHSLRGLSAFIHVACAHINCVVHQWQSSPNMLIDWKWDASSTV